MSNTMTKGGPFLNVIRLFRPAQWVKNAFIFAGAVFSLTLFDPDVFPTAFAGFGVFCAAASAIYIVNDISDRESDRLDSRKSLRPVASGAISLPIAWLLSVGAAVVAVAGALLLSTTFAWLVIGYMALNVAYTLRLKRIVILDVMSIAAGFVIRVVAGTVLANVHISDWLFICTITLSLFLGFGKRRQELVTLRLSETADTREPPKVTRQVLSKYSVGFLDQMISVATASTVVAYIMYTVAEPTVNNFGTRDLIYTVPFVLYGIYRYLYLLHERTEGGDPARALLNDPPILVTCALWVIAVLVIIY